MKTLKKLSGWMVVAALLLGGCSSGSTESGENDASSGAASTPSGLSEFEMEHGIGPVDEVVTLESLDPDMVEEGAQVFKTKCSACHRMSERYVGPALGNVFETRSPTYVMNMILNPEGMVKEHPEAKKMLSQFLTPMPNQNLTQEQAKAILAYLADENEELDEEES